MIKWENKWKVIRKECISAESCEEYKWRSCADKRGITSGQAVGTTLAPVLERKDKLGLELGKLYGGGKISAGFCMIGKC